MVEFFYIFELEDYVLVYVGFNLKCYFLLMDIKSMMWIWCWYSDFEDN